MIKSRWDGIIVGSVALGFLLLSFPGSSFAGPALEAIQQTHGAVLRVLQSPDRNHPDAAPQQELAQIVGQRFNYRAMARHILGEQWTLLREDERAELFNYFGCSC